MPFLDVFLMWHLYGLIWLLWRIWHKFPGSCQLVAMSRRFARLFVLCESEMRQYHCYFEFTWMPLRHRLFTALSPATKWSFLLNIMWCLIVMGYYAWFMIWQYPAFVCNSYSDFCRVTYLSVFTCANCVWFDISICILTLIISWYPRIAYRFESVYDMSSRYVYLNGFTHRFDWITHGTIPAGILSHLFDLLLLLYCIECVFLLFYCIGVCHVTLYVYYYGFVWMRYIDRLVWPDLDLSVINSDCCHCIWVLILGEWHCYSHRIYCPIYEYVRDSYLCHPTHCVPDAAVYFFYYTVLYVCETNCIVFVLLYCICIIALCHLWHLTWGQLFHVWQNFSSLI